ncbi:MAG: hydroxyacylglutathione hydrolase family protein [Actinobacteria bacterium]|nr:hydroxyacylglutathione hydrolase family protein [Actinomycetota bacterium]
MEHVTDENFEVLIAGPAGFGNNIYLVVDRETNEAAFIDAPDEVEQSIEAVEKARVHPSKILLTHSHGDHTASIDKLKQRYGAVVYGDSREPWLKEGQLDHPVSHGDEVRVGDLVFKVLSVPGHTPGSTTYVHALHAFVGDTLFPGGPGRSANADALREEIDSIERHLYALPEATTIYPGHGPRTTIGLSKKEFAIFAANEHDPNLHGDVLWAES